MAPSKPPGRPVEASFGHLLAPLPDGSAQAAECFGLRPTERPKENPHAEKHSHVGVGGADHGRRGDPREPAAAPATGGAILPPPTVLRGSPPATAKPVPTCPPGYTVPSGYGCLAPSGEYSESWPGYDYWPDYAYGYPFGGFTGFGRGMGRFHGFAKVTRFEFPPCSSVRRFWRRGRTYGWLWPQVIARRHATLKLPSQSSPNRRGLCTERPFCTKTREPAQKGHIGQVVRGWQGTGRRGLTRVPNSFII